MALWLIVYVIFGYSLHVLDILHEYFSSLLEQWEGGSQRRSGGAVFHVRCGVYSPPSVHQAAGNGVRQDEDEHDFAVLRGGILLFDVLLPVLSCAFRVHS